MTSSQKTQYYQLNQWLGSDLPKWADHNYDNALIDAALHAIAGNVENGPIIVDGVWRVWDVASSQYVSTGVNATGAPGPQGLPGDDGHEVEFQKTANYIQWRYVGESEWTNLIAVADITGPRGLPGTDGENGADGREIELQISGGYVQWRYVNDANWTNLIPLSAITGPQGLPGNNGADGQDGANGREIELQKTATYVQWRYVGAETWNNLIALIDITGPQGEPGNDGADFTIRGLYANYAALVAAHPAGVAGEAYAVGTALDNTIYIWDIDAEEWVNIGPLQGPPGREIELQIGGDYIQWRYEGETEWNNLIALAALTGPAGSDGSDGREISLRVNGGYVQWQYVGGETWINLVALSTITGPQGAPGNAGREVELQKTATYIQWRYVGESEWANLVALADITGSQGNPGTDGSDGADGREIVLRIDSGYIQWQYDGDASWTNLVALSAITGAPGPNQVTTSTATNISGILKGNGSTVGQAVAGTDYAAPGDIPSAYASNPAMDGTASAGSSTAWAKGDHVHPSDTAKLDKAIEIVTVTANLTLSSTHNGKHLLFTNSSAITITIPSGLGAGYNCTGERWGAGDVGLTPSGVTLNGDSASVTLGDQYGAAVSIIAVQANVISVKGGLA